MKPVIIFCLLPFIFSSCQSCKDALEPEPKKPELTTAGRNTFYCEINGKPYYQKFSGGQMSYPLLIGSYDPNPNYGGVFFRLEYKGNGNTETIIINSKIYAADLYKVDSTRYLDLALTRVKGCSYHNSYKTKSLNGWVNFSRVDFVGGIFSGTFEFKNWLPDSVSGGCDTTRITNGIFDLKL